MLGVVSQLRMRCPPRVCLSRKAEIRGSGDVKVWWHGVRSRSCRGRDILTDWLSGFPRINTMTVERSAVPVTSPP